MPRLTKTQQELLGVARAKGSLHVVTSIKRRGRFHCYNEGGRDWQAAEKLADMGLLIRDKTVLGQAYVKSSMGGRVEMWTDHYYRLAS